MLQTVDVTFGTSTASAGITAAGLRFAWPQPGFQLGGHTFQSDVTLHIAAMTASLDLAVMGVPLVSSAATATAAVTAGLSSRVRYAL
jgi:hypothetical protein